MSDSEMEQAEPKSLSSAEIATLNKIKAMSIEICDLVAKLKKNPGMDEFLNALNIDPEE
jgi:hypothetical protein